MKRFIVLVALATFAAGSLTLASSEDAAAATQSQKRKQKGKATKSPAKPAATSAAAPAAPPSTPTAAPATGATAAGTAAAATTAAATTAAAANAEEEKVVKTDLYTVKGGTRVDEKTMNGFRAWRAAACDRCHGANQEGMVGPSLIESLKRLTKDEVKTTVTNGRLEKGMPSFSTSEQVMKNLDNLYAYLKGRSDGAITKSKVTPID